MKIAVCDDEVKDIEIIVSHIESHQVQHEIVTFTSAIPLLQQINDNVNFDLIFLDVQMPDADGWMIAKQLKQAKIKSYIAMATVQGEYIYNCFDRVDWFTPKPVSMEKVHMILDDAQEKLFPVVFKFKSERINIELTAPEIQYIEAIKNNIHIRTIAKEHKVRLSLNEIKKMLSDFPCFVQIHKSYIVNLDNYEEVNGNDIVMNTGRHIPLSRNFKKNFLNALEIYGRKGFR